MTFEQLTNRERLSLIRGWRATISRNEGSTASLSIVDMDPAEHNAIVNRIAL